MKKRILLAAAVVSFLAACNHNNKLAQRQEYDQYMQGGLVSKSVDRIKKEISFWDERLKKDTGSYGNMLELARYYLSLFKQTGDVKMLETGDSLLKRSSAKLNNTDPNILFSISQNSITRHQFKQAAFYNDAADKANGALYTVTLLQFDVDMELGRYADAERRLASMKDKSSFDYLIRKAKLSDHKGDLDNAIRLMEEALEKVKGKNKGLQSWAQSNLADMYGHAGRAEESYRGYLDVLALDPSNLYCLKGIAWIAYSHDHNTEEAKRILHFILSQTKMPDLKLVLAQIAEYENKPAEKNRLLQEFITDVSAPGYGDMYNKYLLHIYSDELPDTAKTRMLAERELKNRFTPETCDWMAWAKYREGNYEEAFKIAKSYVNGQCFEPHTMLHTAFIYAAVGKKAEAKALLNECEKSRFELGPVLSAEVQQKLAEL